MYMEIESSMFLLSMYEEEVAKEISKYKYKISIYHNWLNFPFGQGTSKNFLRSFPCLKMNLIIADLTQQSF